MMELKTYYLVLSQLDKIFYILTEDTDIIFSLKQIEEILNSYISADGFTFRADFPYKLPWTFAYIAQGLELDGCKIKKDSKLAQELSRYDFIELKERKKYYTVSVKNNFITFEFRNLDLDNNYLDFQIRCTNLNHQNLIIMYDKRLEINEDRFKKLINENITRRKYRIKSIHLGRCYW